MNFIENNEDELLGDFQSHWENARFKKNQNSTKHFAESIFEKGADKNMKLLVKGTAFQLKVWEALLKIPFGSLTSYQTIAQAVGSPGGMRAVGSAVGANPIAYLIPCHRVIRQEAVIGQYRWGTTKKKALIGWERARKEMQLNVFNTC